MGHGKGVPIVSPEVVKLAILDVAVAHADVDATGQHGLASDIKASRCGSGVFPTMPGDTNTSHHRRARSHAGV